jgi:hypothetical protein
MSHTGCPHVRRGLWPMATTAAIPVERAISVPTSHTCPQPHHVNGVPLPSSAPESGIDDWFQSQGQQHEGERGHDDENARR